MQKRRTSRAKITLLSCMLAVEGEEWVGSLRKDESGVCFFLLSLKVTDELVKQNVLDFISGI